jgi:hypothetical protein
MLYSQIPCGGFKHFAGTFNNCIEGGRFVTALIRIAYFCVVTTSNPKHHHTVFITCILNLA